MRIVAWVLLFSFSAQATSPVVPVMPGIFSNFTTLRKDEQQSVRSLVEACSDQKMTQVITLTPEERKYAPVSKKNLARVVVNVAPENSSSPTLIDCESVGVGPFDVSKYPELRPNAEKQCGDSEASYYALTQFSRDALYNAELARCETEGTKLFSADCLKEIGCNVARSLSTGAISWVVKQFSSDIDTQKKSCLGMGQDNCLSSLIDGFIHDLWGMVEGLWTGVKWVGKKIVEGVSWIYDYFSNNTVQTAENDVSKKLIAAKAITDSQISRFVHDPLGYIKESIQNMMSWLMKKVEPLAGDAKIGWKCATCDKLLNAGCRIAGMVGGELMVAFFTGGALNLAGKAGESGKIAEIMEGLSKFGRETAMGKAVMAVGRTANRFVKAVLYLPSKAMEALGKLPGIKQFMSANEAAFMRGYLGKEGFLKLEQAHEVQAMLKTTQSRLGATLSPEEKAILMEHQDVKWAKLSKEEIRAKLESFKEVSAPKISEPISTVAENSPRSALTDARVKSPETAKVVEDFQEKFKSIGQPEIPKDVEIQMDEIHNMATKNPDGSISRAKAEKINDFEASLKSKYGFTTQEAQGFRSKMTKSGVLGIDQVKLVEGQIKASEEMYSYVEREEKFSSTRADDMVPGSSVVYKVEHEGKNFYAQVESNQKLKPVDSFDKKEIPRHKVVFKKADGTSVTKIMTESEQIPSSVYATHNGGQAQSAFASKALGQVSEIGEPLADDFLRLTSYKKGEKFNLKDYVVDGDEIRIQRTIDEKPVHYTFVQRFSDRIILKDEAGNFVRIQESQVKAIDRTDCSNGIIHDDMLKSLATDKASFSPNLYKAAPSIKKEPIGTNPWAK